jgi:hypothetical protein
MRIIGFNFNKINIEKFSDKIEKLKINTNINISEINEMELDLFKTKEQFIRVKFTYNIDYEPKIAKIELVGNIVFGAESKIIKDVLKQWEGKKIPEDFKIILFNVILRKSNLKALQLEEELNLPLHVSLPSLKKQENKEN